MQTTSLSNIQVPPRQRQYFDPKSIADLAEGIAKSGLFHPIVLRQNGAGYILVAGERRLRAMRELHKQGKHFTCNGEGIPYDEVPFTTVEASDFIQQKEMELEENILREDLTWRERSQALAELHELRQGQNPAQTKLDTAREVAGRSIDSGNAARTSPKVVQQELTRALIIKDFLDDPEVARAASDREAFKIVSRKLESQFTQAIQSPSRARGQYACIQGDCREVMSTLKSNWFSCIVADPPYGIGADEFGDAAQGIHDYEDTADEAISIGEAILQHGHRLLKESGHIFIFCDIESFPVLRMLSRQHGFEPWRTPLVWHKAGSGHAPDPNRGPRRNYELILFARKGDHRVKQVFSDVITIPPDKERLHAAQKPVDLYTHLLSWGCLPGDNVLDPCCGSGTLFPAAKKLSLKAVGIEKSEEFYNHSAAIARNL